MRTFFRRSTGAEPLLAAALPLLLALALAGCSTGAQQPYQTSSLSPRPQDPMVRETPRYAEAPRRYVDPGHPTPREFAEASDQYGLASDPGIRTASIGDRPRYSTAPDGRWRQPSNGITTGSTGYGGAGPHVIQVREGDTLYSLSRRHHVPIGDLVAANRLTSERIAVGQHLVIPTRYR